MRCVVAPVNARPVQRRTPDLPGRVIDGRTPPTRWKVPAAGGRAGGAVVRSAADGAVPVWIRERLRRKGVWRGWAWSSVCFPYLQSPLLVFQVVAISRPAVIPRAS